MSILSTIEQDIIDWTKTFEQGAPTKLLSELFVFAAGFPFSQVAGAALAEGTNVPLDITAAIAIFTDISKAFYSGQSVQTATMALTSKVGIPAAVANQIVFTPDPGVPPTSRGR